MKRTALFLFCFFVFLLAAAEAGLVPKEDGIKALNSKDYDRAIEIFQAAVAKEGDSGKLASFCSFFLGKAYYEKGQMEEAVKYLKRAVDVYREGMTVFHLSSAWHFWLGRAYYNTGQYGKAIASFQEAIPLAYEKPERVFDDYYRMFNRNVADGIKNAILPQMPPLASCYFWLGNSYYMNGQYQEAVGTFSKAIELNPKAEIFYTQLGNSYLGLGEYEKAMQAVKRSLEIEQNNPFAYKILAKIYRTMKENEAAIEALKKAIALDPKDMDGYITIANIYGESGNYDEAINTLRKALENSPKNSMGIYYLARNYLAAGRFDEAINALNELLKLNAIDGIGCYFIFKDDYPSVVLVQDTVPYNPAGLEGGDQIIKINGQPTKGNREKFFQVLQSEPGTKITLTIKRQGVKDPVEKTATIGRVFMKSAATPLALRGLTYAVRGDLENFRKDAEMAYSLNQKDAWATTAISFAYIVETPALSKSEKVDEALRILSQSRDLFDRLVEALAYARMGDMRRSLEIYAAIPEVYRESKDVIRNYFRDVVLESLLPYVKEKKEAASVYVSKGQYQEALKEYEEILKMADEQEAKEIRGRIALMIKARPDLFQLSEEARRFVMRAEMANKEGKFEDALKEYREALKFAPFFPQLYKAIALTYEPLKDYRQAIRNMNIYLELYPDAPDAREAKDQIYKWEYMIEKGGK
ncbi:MAG: tetratricopeptide repeat protein [Candidatus Aminicenantes bacterium]|nr:tetratricopeptide repeat protein [Candidatus Aminicenantes bacterium]